MFIWGELMNFNFIIDFFKFFPNIQQNNRLNKLYSELENIDKILIQFDHLNNSISNYGDNYNQDMTKSVNYFTKEKNSLLIRKKSLLKLIELEHKNK